MQDWTNFWLDRWSNNKIGFHQEEVEPNLEKYFVAPGEGAVFVPLCGKTLDLVFLSKKVKKVIGVELSQKACEEFFAENKISFETEKTKDFLIFKSEKIWLYCGDFFKLTPEILKEVSFVYDRASLIALPPELRNAYTVRLVEILKLANSFLKTILLIALEYPEDKKKGPPFSVTPTEVRKLYEKSFSIRHLTDGEEFPVVDPSSGAVLLVMVERVYLLDEPK